MPYFHIEIQKEFDYFYIVCRLCPSILYFCVVPFWSVENF